MATQAESVFIRAVATAEAARQVSKAAAFTTWAYGTGSSLTTYLASLVTADNTYITAVQTAANTAGGIGNSVPNAGSSSQIGIVTLGLVGQTGPIPSASTTFGAVA